MTLRAKRQRNQSVSQSNKKPIMLQWKPRGVLRLGKQNEFTAITFWGVSPRTWFLIVVKGHMQEAFKFYQSVLEGKPYWHCLNLLVPFVQPFLLYCNTGRPMALPMFICNCSHYYQASITYSNHTTGDFSPMQPFQQSKLVQFLLGDTQ